MDSPVAILQKKRPAVECAGRGEGGSVRPVVIQDVGMINNLNCKLMEDYDEKDSGGCVFTLGMGIYEEWGNGGCVGEDQSVGCSLGGFLKYCSYCKRRLRKNMDVYMYGYLKAYCSPGCREEQIQIDERLRPPSPEPSNLSMMVKIIEEGNAELTRHHQELVLDSNVTNHSVSIFD